MVVDPKAYLALLYLLLSLVTGSVFFTIVVTGISVSGGLLVLIIGIPFFLGFLAVVRAISLAEGRIVERLLGTRMPRRSRSEPRGTALKDRIRFWIKDRRTWTAMLYMILLLPLGITYFTVSVTGLAGGLWLVVLPFVQAATGHSYVDVGDGWYQFPTWSLPLMVIAGALVLVLMLHLIRGDRKGPRRFRQGHAGAARRTAAPGRRARIRLVPIRGLARLHLAAARFSPAARS